MGKDDVSAIMGNALGLLERITEHVSSATQSLPSELTAFSFAKRTTMKRLILLPKRPYLSSTSSMTQLPIGTLKNVS